MDQYQYEQLVTRQVNHWWHMGRREILGAVLDKYLDDDRERDIIEIGAGCGGNIDMLSRYGAVTAVEMDDGARAYMASAHDGLEVRGGALPDTSLFAGQQFDVAIMFDVLEHVAEEAESLVAIRQHIRPGGLIFISVPAYEWLWGAHDDRVHHQRRYTSGSLRGALEGAGWSVEQVGHYNKHLFPLAVAARFKDKLTGAKQSTGFKVPAKPVNDTFFRIFSSEADRVARGGFRYGLSVAAVARNPESPGLPVAEEAAGTRMGAAI